MTKNTEYRKVLSYSRSLALTISPPPLSAFPCIAPYPKPYPKPYNTTRTNSEVEAWYDEQREETVSQCLLPLVKI